MGSDNASARILVPVKNAREIYDVSKLLLSKFTQSGSHIVFLHIIQSSEALEKQKALVLMDKVISETLYDRVPKVTISTQALENLEIWSGIIQEARRFKATMVVLGNSKRQFISRSMTKIGKKCVENLPSYCSVMVVRKGKVIHIKSGCSECKGQTLKSLIRKEKKQETNVSRGSSSSCSMETILSFSTDLISSFSSSSSSSRPGSPDTVLEDQLYSQSLSMTNRDEISKSIIEFTYQELLMATQNFARENLAGSGGSSYVYRGTLQDGRTVAIKQLLDSTSGQREFSREIKLISHIDHQNLVLLIGFCCKGTKRLLVYTFLQNGSLEQHLYGNAKVLSWKKRQKIALGIAKGLHHLHQLSPHHIIHQDMKSSNILLTDNFEAQISDFGFARWSNELASGLFGTFGYMAPECLIHGHGNEKTDIHAFGVVLLELISGRAPIDSKLPAKEQCLVHWAHLLERSGTTFKLVDPKLTGVDPHEMKRMMYAAFYESIQKSDQA